MSGKKQEHRHPRFALTCSFCGKEQHLVHRLIAGPGGVYICDECVNLCQEIIAEEQGPPPGGHKSAPDLEPRARWNSKAAYWDEIFQEGNQFHRILIEPSVLSLLDLQPGQTILDVGAGNGALARRLASMETNVVAFDFSDVFIERARARTTEHTDRIEYHVMDATDREELLRLGERRFHAVVSTMALMDIPDIEPLAQTLSTLLRPEGRFVFAVMHPCFNSLGTSMLAEASLSEEGEVITTSMKVDAYLDVPPGLGGGIRGEPNPHPYFHRPLHELFGPFFRQGFVLDAILEPSFQRGGDPLSWDGLGGQIPPALIARMRMQP